MFSQESLLSQLGDGYTSRVTERLHNFAFIPFQVVNKLAELALSEDWGVRNFVLKTYLSVYVPWSIEQGKFTASANQWYVTAGYLQTRDGAPLYLVFEENQIPDKQPFVLRYAGPQIAAPHLPAPPEIPGAPPIERGVEVEVRHQHVLQHNAERVPFLADTPPVAQMCAIAGAVQWSINRGLHVSYWYWGRMNYLVPLYLSNREDITRAPDVVATVQVTPTSLLVRTVLSPHMTYAKARVAAKRHDQLPSWLLSAWLEHAAHTSGLDGEDSDDAEHPYPMTDLIPNHAQPLIPRPSSPLPVQRRGSY